jgi:glycosyltransferase involved in cell wall biosynthesis
MCELSVILEVDVSDPATPERLLLVRKQVASAGAQVIVASTSPWPECPSDVELVVVRASSRGDLFDRAAGVARGSLLAFLDTKVALTPHWATDIAEVFADPEVMIASGPVAPSGAARGQRVSALVMTRYLGSAPAAHNVRSRVAHPVREVGSSNLVIRRETFLAVGGFQSPMTLGGEAVRLCYKVRTILRGRIVSDPRLAVSAPAPSFPGPLLHDIGIYGRSRGDMARRLPAVAPMLPYALPSLAATLVPVILAFLVLADGWLRWATLGVLGFVSAVFILHCARAVRGAASVADKVAAVCAVPVVLGWFGVAFLRGYFGPSLEDISPPRDRDRPMRVLIMNWRDLTHPQSGGAEVYMHEMARRWTVEGIDVAWLTQRSASSARSQVIDGIHFHRTGGRVTMYVRVALTYLRHMRKDYDVIVDCENGIPFFSSWYARVPRVLVVFHVHQQVFRTQLPRAVRWLALWLESWLMPRSYRNSTVVACSSGTRDDLVELGFDAHRIHVVTSGVVPPATQPGTGQASVPTILCMGRLKPQKSVDVLIQAMPAIRAEVPDVHLDIVGQGPDRHRLERLTWELGLVGHVRFHGYVRSSVRDELSAAAWIAACPSMFEGWGVVCMEASARGLPVVASDVRGLRESVRDGETGLLFPYGNTDALKDAVVGLLADEEKRAEMGRAGVRWAAHHTWDNSAAMFADILRAEVAGRPALATDDAAVIDLRVMPQPAVAAMAPLTAEPEGEVIRLDDDRVHEDRVAAGRRK